MKLLTDEERRNDRTKSSIKLLNLWEAFQVLLSLIVLTMLFLDISYPLKKSTREIFHLLDNIICLVFITNFFTHVLFAKKKKEYLRWGWIDLVCSIPNLEIFRWGRLFSILRFLYILRSIRSFKVIFPILLRKKTHNISLSIGLIAALLIVLSTIAILNTEGEASGANIKTPEDALWWAFVTITTVGYGDFYPVSTQGRIISSILMLSGIGLFGAFTAFISSLFFNNKIYGYIKREEHKLETAILEKSWEAEKNQGIEKIQQRSESLLSNIQSLMLLTRRLEERLTAIEKKISHRNRKFEE